MEIIATHYKLNMDSFDLTVFKTDGGYFYYGVGGDPSQAAFQAGDLSVGLNGKDFQFQDADHGNYTPIAGTVEGINIANFSSSMTDYPDLSIAGFSIQIPDLFKIVATAKTTDDHKFLVEFLKGADSITGSEFNDVLQGYGGKDTIKGMGGADKITGGAGTDMLYAGKGHDKDVFIFNQGDSSANSAKEDQIFQFHTGEDKINLKDLGLKASDISLDFHHAQGAGTQSETFVTVDHKGTDSDMKLDVIGAHVHMGDFLI